MKPSTRVLIIGLIILALTITIDILSIIAPLHPNFGALIIVNMMICAILLVIYFTYVDLKLTEQINDDLDDYTNGASA